MYRVLHVLAFAASTLALATEPAKPSIVSLNPADPVPPAPVPPNPVVGPLKLSTGCVQVVKLKGATVSRWLVVQPVGTGGVPWDVVDTEELPKGSPIYAKFEGATKPAKHKFDSDVLVVASLNGSAGFVQVYALDPMGKTLAQTIIAVNQGPRPPPDVDPEPGPKPDGTSPFKGDGFRVLITYDSENTTRPAAQQTILYGKAIRDYLKAKCATGPDGKTKEFRIYPDNTDVSGDDEPWKSVFPTRKGKDWIFIGNGKTGVSQVLPATEAEALELLKKVGGQ